MGRNEASATVFCLNLASLYFRHYNIGIAIISSAILSSLYLPPLFFLCYNFGNPVFGYFGIGILPLAGRPSETDE